MKAENLAPRGKTGTEPIVFSDCQDLDEMIIGSFLSSRHLSTGIFAKYMYLIEV
jgi:hypothetical protein